MALLRLIDSLYITGHCPKGIGKSIKNLFASILRLTSIEAPAFTELKQQLDAPENIELVAELKQQVNELHIACMSLQANVDVLTEILKVETLFCNLHQGIEDAKKIIATVKAAFTSIQAGKLDTHLKNAQSQVKEIVALCVKNKVPIIWNRIQIGRL